MCPKQGQSCILLACRKVGSPKCVKKKELEEREFVVASGACMHMVSEKDCNSVKLETMRTAMSPTTVMTANGEVRTNKEATVYVKQFDLYVTVMLLEETPAVLSLEKLCEEHGYTYHWNSGQNPHHIKNGKRIVCKISNCVKVFVSWNISEFFLNYTFICLVTIFITVVNIGYQRFSFGKRCGNSSIRKKWRYELRASERPVA